MSSTKVLLFACMCLCLKSSSVIALSTTPGPVVNGGWAAWSEWNACSVTCGNGRTIRTRTCTNPTPANGGTYCVGALSEENSCDTRECPIAGHWGQWASWSICSVTCGNGTELRFRKCDHPPPQHGGASCNGHGTESKTCVHPVCIIDGGWSSWSNWSDCSVTCGDGARFRTRMCNSPKPSNGGNDCPGTSTDVTSCSMPVCIIDGGWTSWESTSCSVSCGEGTIIKTRNCTNPVPQNGGNTCAGNVTVIELCSHVCPVDGNWGSWTNWDTCTVTCGLGEQVRTRNCNNPAPVGTGAHCMGPPADIRQCVTNECPIDGGWSNWSVYTSCSVTCGNGTSSRSRTCNNPIPQHGGAACQGSVNETRDCSMVICPVDGGWGNWHQWSGCTQTCGGQQYRQRFCDNPTPRDNGRDCIGSSTSLQDCPTICVREWSAWSEWTNCTVQCGQGHRKRTRSCLPSSTRRRDADCFGLGEEIKVCDAGSCASQFKVCDKVHVFTAIFRATNVDHTGSPTCPDNIHHADVAVIEEFCSAPTDTSIWKVGIQVYGHCESIPLYVPVGKVDSANRITEDGILLECITDGFKVAGQNCEHVLRISIIQGAANASDYRVISW